MKWSEKLLPSSHVGLMDCPTAWFAVETLAGSGGLHRSLCLHTLPKAKVSLSIKRLVVYVSLGMHDFCRMSIPRPPRRSQHRRSAVAAVHGGNHEKDTSLALCDPGTERDAGISLIDERWPRIALHREMPSYPAAPSSPPKTSIFFGVDVLHNLSPLESQQLASLSRLSSLAGPTRPATLKALAALRGSPYAGCASIESADVLRLWPSPFDVASLAGQQPFQRPRPNSSIIVTACRTRPPKVRHVLIIPTYEGHRVHFDALMNSIARHVVGDGGAVRVAPVLSSVSEMQSLLKPLRPRSNVELHPLLFDYPYRGSRGLSRHGHLLFKFKYQCAKKLWALSHLNYDHALVLDSDFVFGPVAVHLTSLINVHKRTLVPNPSDGLMWIDQMVLRNVNELLDSKYTIFPLELPWVIESSLLGELLRFLVQKLSVSSVPALFVELMQKHTKVYFEVILYRLFVLAHAPGTYTQVVDEATLRRLRREYGRLVVGDPGPNGTQVFRMAPPIFLFDMPLTQAEREALNYPFTSSYVWQEAPRGLPTEQPSQPSQTGQSGGCCSIRIHNDRTTVRLLVPRKLSEDPQDGRSCVSKVNAPKGWCLASRHPLR